MRAESDSILTWENTGQRKHFSVCYPVFLYNQVVFVDKKIKSNTSDKVHYASHNSSISANKKARIHETNLVNSEVYLGYSQTS